MSIGHKSSATGLNMTSSSGWNGLPPRFAAALRGASSSSLSSDDGAQFLPRGTLSPGRGFRQGLACVSTTKRVRRGATGRHAGRHAVRMPCAAGTHCGVEDLPSCWLMTAALRCDASAGAGTLGWLMRLPPLLRDALSESPRSIAAWPLVTRCAWGRPASTEATRQLVSTGAGPAPGRGRRGQAAGGCRRTRTAAAPCPPRFCSAGVHLPEGGNNVAMEGLTWPMPRVIRGGKRPRSWRAPAAPPIHASQAAAAAQHTASTCGACMAQSGAAAAPPTTLPPDNAGYLEREYWDARFAQEDEYEWFRGCVPRSRPLSAALH